MRDENVKRKVIFLDIDGVLCTHRTMVDKHTWQWDPVGCEMLNRLLKKYPKWSIVMSSTWRLGGGANMILRSHGFTQIHYDEATISLNLANSIRGDEIKEWLSRHQEVDDYIILDDDGDFFDWQKPRLVQTCLENGLLMEHYRKLDEMMKGSN